jgi:uncharacterized protein YhfF
MRDRLNALVLAGEKTATAGLWKDEYGPEDEPIDVVGEEQILLNSSDEPLAIVEITRVEALRLDAVPWEFAKAEGEGFRSIEHWRDGHRSYYDGQGVTVNDDDLVVCVWLAVRDVLGGS